MEALIKEYMIVGRAESGKERKALSFGRGSRRRKFASANERRAYEACFKSHAKLEKWKKEKAALLKTMPPTASR